MLVTIAAAVLALAPVERPAPQPAAKSVLIALEEARPMAVCKGAGRMQVKTEPALLYRADPDERIRKLIEMPMAQACLLGGSR